MRKAKKALLFVNKKKQKNFAPGGVGTALVKSRRRKSFLLLFFKKEALAFFNYFHFFIKTVFDARQGRCYRSRKAE
jgi:hypothetical protein